MELSCVYMTWEFHIACAFFFIPGIICLYTKKVSRLGAFQSIEDISFLILKFCLLRFPVSPISVEVIR